MFGINKMNKLLVGAVGAITLVVSVACPGRANEQIKLQRAKQDALYSLENISSSVVNGICNNNLVNKNKVSFALTIETCKSYRSKYADYEKQISNSVSHSEVVSKELEHIDSVLHIESTYKMEFARREFYQNR